MRSLWTWTIIAWFAVVAAAVVEAFLIPTAPSSKEAVAITPMRVVIASGLRGDTPFPDSVAVWENDRKIVLAASGNYTRSRPLPLIGDVSVYEVASYLEFPPTGSTEEMLASIWRDDGSKVYLLRFLFPLPGWQLRKAVHDEMARSFDDVPVEEHQEAIDRLLKTFEGGASTGDVFYLVRLTGNRILLGVRDEKNLQLVTDSPALARAIWRMWAGPTAEPGRSGLVGRLKKSAP